MRFNPAGYVTMNLDAGRRDPTIPRNRGSGTGGSIASAADAGRLLVDRNRHRVRPNDNLYISDGYTNGRVASTTSTARG